MISEKKKKKQQQQKKKKKKKHGCQVAELIFPYISIQKKSSCQKPPHLFLYNFDELFL